MKNEIMAQFLVPGDIVKFNRRLFVITNVKTVGEETSILYKNKNSQRNKSLLAFTKFNKSDFLTVINDGRL